MGFGNIDNDDALVDVDLGRRQADSGGRVHGLGHVVDQFADARIDCGHRLGDGVQAGIGIMQDIESGHKKVYE